MTPKILKYGQKLRDELTELREAKVQDHGKMQDHGKTFSSEDQPSQSKCMQVKPMPGSPAF